MASYIALQINIPDKKTLQSAVDVCDIILNCCLYDLLHAPISSINKTLESVESRSLTKEKVERGKS